MFTSIAVIVCFLALYSAPSVSVYVAVLFCIGTCSVILFSSFSVFPSIFSIMCPFTSRVGSCLSVIVTWIVSGWLLCMLLVLFSVSVAFLCFSCSSGVLLLLSVYSLFPLYTALILYVLLW